MVSLLLLSLLAQTKPADNIQPLLTLRARVHIQKMEAEGLQALKVAMSHEPGT